MIRSHLVLMAMAGLVVAACGPSAIAIAAKQADSKPEPKPGHNEFVVQLQPCSIERTGTLKITIGTNGQPKIEEPKPEPMVRGVVTLGGQEIAFYLPANGPYSLTSAKNDSLENTSTLISVDANHDGTLDAHEGWWASLPVRLGDQMFTVKEVDPGGKWILFAKSYSALAGAIVGKPCPDFTYTTMDGLKVSLADFKGKALILDIWSMT